MANYATLKAAIAAVIKQNGTNAITGALLQQSLLSMIDTLGAGYLYMGIAIPGSGGTNPGTPDTNVVYLAGPGEYPNFDSTVVRDGCLATLKYNGSWTMEYLSVGNQMDGFGSGLITPKIIDGEYVSNTNGAFVQYSNWSRSEYINIGLYGSIVITTSRATNYCAVYDENKTFIRNIQLVSGENLIEFVTGDNYICVSDATAYMNQIEFSIGSFLTGVLKTQIDELNTAITNVQKVITGITFIDCEPEPGSRSYCFTGIKPGANRTLKVVLLTGVSKNIEFYVDSSYSGKITLYNPFEVVTFVAPANGDTREIRLYSPDGGIIPSAEICFCYDESVLKYVLELLQYLSPNEQFSQLLKINVSEWNIGYWNNGVQPYGVDNSQLSTLQPRVRDLATLALGDIMVLTEFVTYFDRNGTITSYDTILKQFFDYYYDRGDNKPAIFSKYPFVGSVGSFIHGGNYTKGVFSIKGKEIIVCAIHLTSNESDVAVRTQNCQDLVDEYADAPYVIVTGDFNNYPQDNQAELQPFVNAGWNLGNCGYWGKKNTYNPNYPSHPGEWYIDNIITKGLHIDNFKVITDDDRAGVSDHFPVSSIISALL